MKSLNGCGLGQWFPVFSSQPSGLCKARGTNPRSPSLQGRTAEGEDGPAEGVGSAPRRPRALGRQVSNSLLTERNRVLSQTGPAAMACVF